MKTLKRFYRYFNRIAVVLIAFSLALSGCKNGGGPTESDPPEPTIISSSFESEDTNFLPGEVQFITIDGTRLTDTEYKAMVSGTEILLYRYEEDMESKTLLFFVPEEAVQNHELAFIVNEQEQILDFSIKEYDVIEDPETFTSDILTNVGNDLQVLINETEDSQFKNQLQVAYDSLQVEQAKLPELSEQEIKLLARVLDTYLVSSKAKYSILNSSSLSSIDIDCKAPLEDLIIDIGLAAGSLYALSLSGTVASTGWGLVVGGAVAVVSGAALYGSLKILKNDLGIFWDKCIEESVDASFTWLFEDENFGKRAKRQELIFAHAETKEFSIISEYEAPEELQTALDDLKSLMGIALDLIPQSWVDIINHDYIVEKKRETSAFNIQNISNSDIESNISEADSVLSLTFAFDEASDIAEPQEFTFTLNDSEDTSIEVEATLNPPLPVAYDVQVTVEVGESISGTLKADYAATFTIESDGENGNVTLLDETTGQFGYDRGDSFTGTDSFTFSATNSSGTSEVAMVSIQVKGENEFTYDGKTYPLEWGYIDDFKEYTKGFRNFDFLLAQKEGRFETDYYDTSNSDYVIYLWLESLGSGSFDSGTYEFSSDTTVNRNFLYDGELYFSDDNGEELNYQVIVDGVVEVSISGNIYTLVFDLILENGKPLKGNLSYPMEIIINDSEENTSSGIQQFSISSKKRLKNK